MRELIDHSNLAVASRHALDRAHFPRPGIEFQLRSVDIFGRHYARQRRHCDFARRCRYHIKGKTASLDAAFQKLDKRRNRALEAQTAAGLDQMLATNARETPGRGGSNMQTRHPAVRGCCEPSRQHDPEIRKYPAVRSIPSLNHSNSGFDRSWTPVRNV